MMQLKFSESQAQCVLPVFNDWIKEYLQARYGQSWQWYWMNWQFNHELLL
jgi:hypothetical protein